MEGAVEDELQRQPTVVETTRSAGELDARVGEEVCYEAKALAPEPEGEGEEEGKAGGIAEEVELVWFAEAWGEAVCFCLCSFCEESLRDDILGDEEEGGAEGVEEAPELGAEGGRAGHYYAEGKGYEGKVGRARVVDVEVEAVGEHGEERGEAFYGVD